MRCVYSPSMSVKSKDLPESVTVDWLNEFLAEKKIGKSDIATLSVSAQVLVTELFEELDLLTTQVTSSSLPALAASLDGLNDQLKEIKQECAQSGVPDTFQPARLTQLLATIADLNRARNNLETVQAALSTAQ